MDQLNNLFFIIGMGIGSPDVLSKKALNILKSVDEVYFEIYTNYTNAKLDEYQDFLKRPVIPLYRKTLENDSKVFLTGLKGKNTALLVSGDPFIATTHFQLFLEAIHIGLDSEVINNVSIHSLVPSLLGLSSYKFGKTATIPFHDRIASEKPYITLAENIKVNAHTILLLDIDLVNNKFLTINKAIKDLLSLEEKLKQKIISPKAKAIAVCKLGSPSSKILYSSLEDIMNIKWKNYGPPQTLIIPGKMNSIEVETLEKIWGKNGFHLNLFRPPKRIVVTGTFDVLHPGHLAFFKNAKKLLIPSELWVVVARNSSVSSFKKRDPILDEIVRLEMLSALEIVDKAILGNEGKDKIKIIEEIRPHLIVLGYDQWIDEAALKEELAERNLATKVVRLGKFGNDGYSSSTEIRKKIASTVNNRKD